jgi:hypothetical protein
MDGQHNGAVANGSETVNKFAKQFLLPIVCPSPRKIMARRKNSPNAAVVPAPRVLESRSERLP